MANHFYTSDGERITDSIAKSRYSRMLAKKHGGETVFMCEACGKKRSDNNSHIIAKARCKELHKGELYYDPRNVFNSCQACHDAWEGYKSGEFRHFLNLDHCMLMTEKHDPERYLKRLAVLEEFSGNNSDKVLTF